MYNNSNMHLELLQCSLSGLSLRKLELLLCVNVALLHVEECIFVVLHQPHACISAAMNRNAVIGTHTLAIGTFVPPPHFRRTNVGS